jgi:hypothetical protein
MGSRRIRLLIPALCSIGLWITAAGPAAQSDLDAFMQRVMTRRDDNWTKLQQYILDEREEIEIRGPDRNMLWGEHRDFTWFARDGYFVRSPVRVNGVTIGEGDRRKAEEDFLRREQKREKETDARTAAAESREPQFITSAYFLRFKFEPGRYALVGRETFEGRDALRVEYYPTQLFSDDRARRDQPSGSDDRAKRRERDEPLENEFRRVMNKGALVTLWIDQASHQILKYTFDNVTDVLSAISMRANSLPLDWLARVEELSASMTMGQPFPEVWLPRALEMRIGVAFASGAFDVRYAIDYHDYRQADVRSTIRVPDVR